jgi:Transposase and inactivated derivatives, IS30 family
MQVFGLPRHVTRSAGAASRLLGAKTPSIEALRRRDAVARWRRAMTQGLTAEQAAKAVGASRASLYRWEAAPEPKSRRPHKLRKVTWTPELAQAVEALRLDNPMWGKRKIAALLRQDGGSSGVVVSASKVGRILRKLMDRGVVVPVPTLRHNPGARRCRPTALQRYARRLPKGLKPSRPGEIVQVDTLFVNVRPDKAIKHFTAYDPVAKWTTGHVATRATATTAAALLDKLITQAPFKIEGIQVDGGSEFKAAFEQACKEKGLLLYVLPPKRPQLNGAVERNQGAWRYEFYASFDLPHRIDKLQPLVDAFAYRFNHHRPHQALGDLTPVAYLASISSDATASHMT